MTQSVFLTALREALRSDLGDDWEVHAADNDWTALELLAGTRPGRYRCILQAGTLEAIGGDPTGLLCRQTTAAIVQVRRGMGEDATAQAEGDLLDAEECVRRHLIGFIFQLPGDPAYTSADIAGGRSPHPTVSQFHHEGSDLYTPGVEDVLLEHPARVVRFSNQIVLSTPDNLRPVYLPE